MNPDYPELARGRTFPSDDFDPTDPDRFALSILKESARCLAPAMVPVAEMTPNGSVVMNANTVTGANTPTGIPIQWPDDGFLVAIRASTRDGLATSMAALLLRVQIDGHDDLFPSGAGAGAGYMPLSMISGAMSQFGRYAVRKKFRQATQWIMYFENTTASTTIVADIAFDFVATGSPRL